MFDWLPDWAKGLLQHGPVFQVPGPVHGPTTGATGTAPPSAIPVTFTTDTCPGGTWWAKRAIQAMMLLFILLGLVGVLFGNKEIDKTVIEAAAA